MDIDMIRMHLAMAERHVLEGSLRVRRQKVLVKQLREDEHDLGPALDLLREFEKSFALSVQHRERIRSELKQAEIF